jgi:hypothetical protein
MISEDSTPMDPSASRLAGAYMIPFRRDDVADGLFESLLRCTHDGFHPVPPGDKYADGHYKVIRKLGWESYSTIWLAEEIRQYPKNSPLIEAPFGSGQPRTMLKCISTVIRNFSFCASAKLENKAYCHTTFTSV